MCWGDWSAAARQGRLISTCSPPGSKLRWMISRSGGVRTSRSGNTAPAIAKPSAIERRLAAFACWLIRGTTNLSVTAAPLPKSPSKNTSTSQLGISWWCRTVSTISTTLREGASRTNPAPELGRVPHAPIERPCGKTGHDNNRKRDGPRPCRPEGETSRNSAHRASATEPDGVTKSSRMETEEGKSLTIKTPSAGTMASTSAFSAGADVDQTSEMEPSISRRAPISYGASQLVKMPRTCRFPADSVTVCEEPPAGKVCWGAGSPRRATSEGLVKRNATFFVIVTGVQARHDAWTAASITARFVADGRLKGSR